MGRPPKWKDIPAEQVRALAQIGCKAPEIGAFFGVSHDLISRRFATEMLKGGAMRKIKLRKMQEKLAESGNAAMLIFLGKNELGQSDKLTVERPTDAPKTVRTIRELESTMNGHGANGDGFHRS